ncbi:MAG: hypothetical protein AAF698_03255 [Pseudomonadota bacterium]
MLTRALRYSFAATAVALFAGLASAPAQDTTTEAPAEAPVERPEAADMDLAAAVEVLQRLDSDAQIAPDGRFVQVTIRERELLFIADPVHNRMRLMSAIRPAEGLTGPEMIRIMQANFDSALDARYAIARGTLWSVYVHPLRELTETQFVAAIGQVVNAAETYGTSYSSGLITFGGGDAEGLRRRQLIDELLEEAEPI